MMNAKEVQSLAEAQQRSMETTAAEMKKMVDLIGEFGNDELRLQMEDSRRKVLEGFAVVVESSIPTMKGINFSSSSSSISVYKNLHQLGSLLKCEELREATAMMLGALTLAPDMDIFEIEYLKDDLVKAFSSPVFPYLYSEDEFYECLEDAMKSFGVDESGVSEDLKRNLILTLDKNHLSEIKLLEDFIDGYDWKDDVLKELEKNSNVTKRTFRFSHSITLTRSDLSNERMNSLVSSFFERNPHVLCVLDISDQDGDSGKTLIVDNFPSTIRDLSFTNCEKYSSIGDDFLCNSSLISVDFSGFKNVTTIENNFLSSCESLEVVVGLNNLTTMNENFCLKGVTAIGSGFLSRCRKLESVDLCSFDKVTVISDSFLWGCKSLKDISNMSGLSNVKSIGKYFLSGCDSLVSVDTSALKSVTSIDEGFLIRCKKLESVDLCSFDKVTVISDEFLSHCKSLKDISNMSGLSNVKSIGKYFLAGCDSLVSVDTSALKSVTSIDEGFLIRCKKLESVDLCSFDKVTVISDEFLSHCKSLKDISNMSGLSNVKSIGKYFLSRCDSLVSVDTSALKSVTSIDEGFLIRCKKLESVDLCSFDKVTVISDEFLSHCKSLKDISNMSGLSNVKSIGKYFLSGCDSLVSVDTSALKSVTSIDEGFLIRCKKLESVDLCSFDKVTVISDEFLSHCKSLKDISNMSGLSNVKSIGKYFLSGCDSLVSVDTSALKSVTSIDEGFLIRCKKLESVDLCSFDKVTVISDEFLSHCKSLKDISNMSGLSNVKKIGEYFLFGCDSLVAVDTSALKSVTSIDKGFLWECMKLESVDLCSFDKVTVISVGFLSLCKSLKDISNMSGLSNVKKIGEYFLAGCDSLVSVDTSALKSVTSIDKGFLWECMKLESVDLCSFDKVTVISDGFLCKCESLKDISNMSGLSNVKKIGEYFLAGCDSLVSVDTSALKSVTSIDKGFLLECKKLESVDLRSFDKITVISDEFLSWCESLKDISNMSGLSNVKEIGEDFLSRCDSLVSVDASALKSRLLSEP